MKTGLARRFVGKSATCVENFERLALGARPRGHCRRFLGLCGRDTRLAFGRGLLLFGLFFGGRVFPDLFLGRTARGRPGPIAIGDSNSASRRSILAVAALSALIAAPISSSARAAG